MEPNNKIKVQFLGAAGTVTGSKYLVEYGDKKILIDCGLFQGLKELRLRNWSNLPLDVSSINCVLLTHGHLDHCGYLPLLVKQGFAGTIFGTAPTLEITRLVLKDGAKIQEEEAERANLHNYSRHKPAKPLYDTKDAEAVFPFFKAVSLDQWTELFPEISYRFRYNAHIIGAAFIELKIQNKLLVFSGDIGREDILMRKPEHPEEADFLFMESTYGDKIHTSSPDAHLCVAINKAAAMHGTIIIPGFAVERIQLLMYYIWKLRQSNKIPPLKVYVDSPMGSEVLTVFQRHYDWHKLQREECIEMCKEVHVIKKIEETLKVASDKTPKIIIASSGMASGGRVLTYFEHYLDKPNTTILLTGYQGEGTRGRRLLDGEKEIKIRGKFWPVKAHVTMVDGLSAHADQAELIDWISAFKKRPEKVFIVHGEAHSAKALAQKIKETYDLDCEIPRMYDQVELNVGSQPGAAGR